MLIVYPNNFSKKKRTQHFKCNTIFLLVFILISSTAQSQLSGSYTVDGSKAATSSNYTDIKSFISDLNSGNRSDGGNANGPGLNAHVKIELSQGTYKETISFDSIKGISNLNTITIIGSKANITKIVGDAGSTYSPVINLGSGSQHITFKHISFSNELQPNSPDVINLSNTHDITFDSCRFTAFENPLYKTGQLLGGNRCFQIQSTRNVSVLNSNMLDSGGTCIWAFNNHNLTVKKCSLKVVSYEPNNQFGWSSYIPVVMTHTAALFGGGSSLVFENNDIIQNPVFNHEVSSFPVSCNSMSTIDRSISISNNRMYSEGGGFMVYNCHGLRDKPIQMVGNEVINYASAENQGEIEITNSSNGNIYHNSLRRSDQSSADSENSGVIEISNCKKFDIKNNIVISKGKKPCLFIEDSDTISQNHNVFWNEDYNSTNIIRIDNESISADSLEKINGNHSTFINPLIKSNVDLRPKSSCALGDSLGIVNDRNDSLRKPIPHVGAYVPLPSDNEDVGLAAITSPKNQITKSSQDIEVVVKNWGKTDLDSVNISYSINGSVPISKSFSFTSSLKPCDAVSVIIATNVNFTGCSKLKIWATSKNDQFHGNDSITTDIGLPISAGKYDVGMGHNFTSFAHVLESLKCSGIEGNGNVIFNIEPDTLSGGYSLPSIINVDSSSQLIFQSKTGKPDDVVLKFESLDLKLKNANYVYDRSIISGLHFDGASFVQFRNITVEALDSAWNHVIYLNSDCNNVSFKGCNFKIANVPFNLIYTSQVNSIVEFSPNIKLSNILFDSCLFVGGYRQIHYRQVTPTDSFTVRNSTFMPNGSGGMALESYEAIKLNFRNNIIKSIKNTHTYNYGLSLYGTDSSIISGNIIQGFDLLAAIGVNNSTNLDVFNNMISIEVNRVPVSSSFGYNGILSQYNQNVNFLHNSIALKVNHPNVSFAHAFKMASNSNNPGNIYNNIFSFQTENSEPTNSAVNETQRTSSTSPFNYNIYNTNVLDHTLLSKSYKAGSKEIGSQSLSKYPHFKSFWDLHLEPGLCSGVKGTTTLVNHDIDGDSRVYYHIGADEADTSRKTYNMVANEIAKPEALIPFKSKRDIILNFTNLGLQSVDSLVVGYQWLGDTKTRKTYFTKGLRSCASDTVHFTQLFDSFEYAYLDVFTGDINGQNDQVQANDTLSKWITVERMNDASIPQLFLNFTSQIKDTLSFGVDTLNIVAMVQNPIKFPLNESFKVTCMIEDTMRDHLVWSEQQTLDSLNPYFSKLATFQSFNGDYPGNLVLSCFVDYPGDHFPENDSIFNPVAVLINNDLSLMTINQPKNNSVWEGTDSIYPSVTIRNAGQNDQNTPFDVVFEIIKDGKKAYTSTKKISSLKLGQSLEVTADDFFLSPLMGEFTLTARVSSLLDDYQPNNSKSILFDIIHTHDVVLNKIQQPTSLTRVQNTGFKPTVVVQNIGTSDATGYKVVCTIEDETGSPVYYKSITDTLTSGANKTIVFPDYIADQKGELNCIFFVKYSLDQYHTEDTLNQRFMVKNIRDISVKEIISPIADSSYGIGLNSISLSKSVENVGISDVTTFFFSYVEIRSNQTTVFKDSILTSSIKSDEVKQILFKSHQPKRVGKHTALMFTSLYQDDDRSNDTISVDFHVNAKYDLSVDSFSNASKYQHILRFDDVDINVSTTNFSDSSFTDSVQVTCNVFQASNSVFQSIKKIKPKLDEHIEMVFKSFIPQEADDYLIEVIAAHPKDQNQYNDTLRKWIKVNDYHDAGLDSFAILKQGGILNIKKNYEPEISITNHGTSKADATVDLTILEVSANKQVYSNAVNFSLEANKQTLVPLPSHTFSAKGKYEALAILDFIGDEDQTNDTLRVEFDVDDLGDVKQTQKELFDIHPNPSNGVYQITLKSENAFKPAEVKIYTAEGILLKKQLITTPEASIDITQYPAGAYFGVCSIGGRQIRFTLVKVD